MELDRRNFLKGAAIVGAAAAATGLAACSPAGGSSATQVGNAEASGEKKYSFETPPKPIDESKIKETIEADVIIIGSGVSGLVCGARLSQLGVNMRMFSASSQPVSRGGSNHGIGTKAQKRYGIPYDKYSLSPMFKRQMADGAYRMDQNKWWRFINNSAEAMDWLIDIMEGAGYDTTLECGYDDPDGTFSYQPSSHGWVGGDVTNGGKTGQTLVTDQLEKIILKSGNVIDYDTIAQYLIRDDNNTGRVSAVIALDKDGNYKKYVGKRAIVMATGDFSGDREMMEKYCPWPMKILNPSWELNYNACFQFGGLFPGDGQKMGLWVGAAWQRLQPNAPMILSPTAVELPKAIATQNFTGINLNKNGVRYMNEDTTATYSVMTIMNQPEMLAYFMWEADYCNFYDAWRVGGTTIDQDKGPKPLNSQEMLEKKWEAGVETGFYLKADTIEELLDKFGDIDKEKAIESVKRYNEIVEKGVDEDFHKNPVYFAPLKKGPFYGQRFQVSPADFLCACGGLRTNKFLQVCEEDDTPIEGLFNIGIMVGDAFSTIYNFGVEGHNLGMNCDCFGYLLAKDIAGKGELTL